MCESDLFLWSFWAWGFFVLVYLVYGKRANIIFSSICHGV